MTAIDVLMRQLRFIKVQNLYELVDYWDIYFSGIAEQ